MKAGIRLGKISSIDYAKGMARVVYHEKDDDVTRLIPLLSHEYKMPPVGSQVLVVHLSNGTEAGVVLGRPWSEKNMPPEGGAALYRKDLGQSPGEAMIRYDGSTLTIQCAGAIRIEAGGALTINGATRDLNSGGGDHAGSGKNYGRGRRDHRRGTFRARPAPLPGAVQRGNLRGLFVYRADQRPGRRYGREHHHRAGRVLWVQPGRGGGRQRDGADQRESGGQNRRRPGAP